MDFYKHIREEYGNQIASTLKLTSKLNEKLWKAKNRRIFLFKIKQENTKPTFLNSVHISHINIKNKKTGQKLIRQHDKFRITILNTLTIYKLQ